MKPGRKPFALGCAAGCLSGVIVTVAIIVVGSLLAKPFMVRRIAQNLEKPPISIGTQADYDWQLTTMEGAPFDMGQTRGQPVFLQFWHPDCIPCLAEIQAANGLYTELRDSRAMFIAVGMGAREEIEETIQEEGIAYPVYLLEGPRPAVYQQEQSPATYIIAPDGEIVFEHFGAARWDDPATVAYLRQWDSGAEPAS